jgi:hypothetical protein
MDTHLAIFKEGLAVVAIGRYFFRHCLSPLSTNRKLKRNEHFPFLNVPMYMNWTIHQILSEVISLYFRRWSQKDRSSS